MTKSLSWQRKKDWQKKISWQSQKFLKDHAYNDIDLRRHSSSNKSMARNTICLPGGRKKKQTVDYKQNQCIEIIFKIVTERESNKF